MALTTFKVIVRGIACTDLTMFRIRHTYGILFLYLRFFYGIKQRPNKERRNKKRPMHIIFILSYLSKFVLQTYTRWQTDFDLTYLYLSAYKTVFNRASNRLGGY